MERQTWVVLHALGIPPRWYGTVCLHTYRFLEDSLVLRQQIQNAAMAARRRCEGIHLDWSRGMPLDISVHLLACNLERG